MVFLVRRAGLPIVVECGDVVIFSAAHLHRSIPNTTDKTRFSAEVRTVYMPDVVAGRGAPNVDSAAASPKLKWFAPSGPA